MIDLSDPTLDERLHRRTAEGRYEISEIELVKTIRVLQAQSNTDGVRRLSEVLLSRCAPAFQRHTQGLRHRPDLREEAIANMAEHLLREVQDPHLYTICAVSVPTSSIAYYARRGYTIDVTRREDHRVARSMYHAPWWNRCGPLLLTMRVDRLPTLLTRMTSMNTCTQRWRVSVS